MGVPTIEVIVLLIFLENPKSAIFNKSLSNKRLAGFMSLWIKLFYIMHFNPLIILLIILRADSSLIGLFS